MSERTNPFAVNEVASGYDAWFETPLGRAIDALEKDLLYELADPYIGERALDVGTGTGHFACDLAAQGLEVTACDPSLAMLEVARAKDCPVTWQQASAEALPFEDDTYDLVLSVTALEFVADRQKALAEMYRVVAPGGRLVVGVLNKRSRVGQAYIEQSRIQETPFSQAHFYTADELLTDLERLGEVRWGSAVFIGLSPSELAIASVLEKVGRRLLKDRGALLIGRVDK